MSKKSVKLLCLLLCLVLYFSACTPIPVTLVPLTPEAGEEDVPRTPSGVRDALPEDEDLSPIQYDARYFFEQFILPMSIFTDEAEVIADLLAGDVDEIREHTLFLWEFAAANAILQEMTEAGEDLPPPAEMLEFAAVLRPAFGLGDEHIAAVTIAEIDADTSAFIIELLDIDVPWISTHIGIAYNEAMGLRVFTLERIQDFAGTGVAAHMFCFISADSRGSFHPIANDRQSFIDAIAEAMNGLIEPAAGFWRGPLN